MCSCAECHTTHVVVNMCFSHVIHVANGNHPMGCQRQFYESVSPVALVVRSSEVLQLCAQRCLGSYLPLAVGNKDVAVNPAAFTFYNSFVVYLVHVHKCQPEVFRQSARHLHVNVLIVGCSLPTYMREVQFHVHSIASAQCCIPFEIISCFCLPRPFAVCKLGGVWIKGC